MIKKLLINIFFVFIVLHMNGLSAQTISSPNFLAGAACASPNFNSYDIEVSYTAPGFPAGNVFSLELSDANGSFASPQVLSTLSLENFPFDHDFTFANVQFPTDTAGDNYKFRVTASSPSITGLESAAFSAYFYDSRPISINNWDGSILSCGSPITLKISPDIAVSYTWLKDGAILPGVTGNTYQTSAPGTYKAFADLGGCSNSYQGTDQTQTITVIDGTNANTGIRGPSVVSICDGDIHTFTAEGVTAMSNIRWLRDGTPMTAFGPNSTYTTPSSGADGLYTFEVQTGITSCGYISLPVELKYRNDSTVHLSNTPSPQLILPGESLTLAITTTTSSPNITWYRNGSSLTIGQNSLTLDVNQPGHYYAKVHTPSSCSNYAISPDIFIKEPDGYNVSIKTEDSYTECQNVGVGLEIEEIVATLTSGLSKVVPSNSSSFLQYQWLENAMPILGANNSTYSVPNGIFTRNYELKVTVNSNSFYSNDLSIKIFDYDTNITVSQNVLCDGLTATLQVTNNPLFLYQWFKNGTLIPGAVNHSLVTDVEGEYHCEVSNVQCTRISSSEIIILSDESLITLDPGPEITLLEGESRVVSASGGSFYEWINSEGITLGTGPSITFSQEGDYTLRATVGLCDVELPIRVDLIRNKNIQNVVTPNGDGLNDYWILSDELRNDQTTVIIYNSAGQIIYRTTNYSNTWPDNNSISNNQGPVVYYSINNGSKVLHRGTITFLKL